jgi:hypothetical protein
MGNGRWKREGGGMKKEWLEFNYPPTPSQNHS